MLLILLTNLTKASDATPKVLALRLQETDDKSYYNTDGEISVESGANFMLEIISAGLKDGSYIKLIT